MDGRFDSPQQRLFRQARLAFPGGGGGTIENVGPRLQPAGGVRAGRRDRAGGISDPPPWSMKGTVVVASSGHYFFREDAELVEVFASVTQPSSSGDIDIDIYKGASVIGTLTIPQGDTEAVDSFSETYVADTDALAVGVSAAGTGAAALVVQPRIAL